MRSSSSLQAGHCEQALQLRLEYPAAHTCAVGCRVLRTGRARKTGSHQSVVQSAWRGRCAKGNMSRHDECEIGA